MSDYYLREYMRDNYGINRKKKFNIIGFGPRTGTGGEQKQFRHCSIDRGIRLLPVEGDDTVLQCPACGMSYPIQDTIQEQNVQTDITPASKTKIITGKNRKKKFYDKYGNLITDETLLQDIARGATVYSYHEEN